nr:hypothetical protein [uncultured Flavobacterium sp.]
MTKISTFFFLLFSCTCLSQTTKLIRGQVSYQGSYQQNIEVINYNTKKMTRTNTLGQFEIEAKVDDVLVLLSSHFTDQKYTVTAEDFDKAGVFIKLSENPIPLKEVEILQVKAIKLESVSYNELKMAQIEKQSNAPKVQGVYTGEIENGVDFIQIGKMIGKLFKGNKPKEEKQEAIPFILYAKANFNESFFTKTLKVKPEDTGRFLAYCEADPKSKTVTQKNDELTILEFLLTKKAEFDQLK